MIRLINNEIRSNNKEGIYVVNTASLAQGQSGATPTPGTPDDPNRGMDGGGNEDAVPRLVLEVHDNRILDSGQLLDSDSTGA